MIKQQSIERILERADIVEVVGEFVDLKKAGSNWKGLSPFTSEKTPSFMVSSAKQIFKCFSSGKGGGAITFLQELNSWTFVECMEHLAKKYGLELEREESKVSKEEIDHIERLRLCSRAASNRWLKKLGDDAGSLEYLKVKRGLEDETIYEWELGYAPDTWDFIKDPLIQSGYFNEGIELGLIKRKGERNYDAFRNRIIFPIRDHTGQLVGFGGRDLSGEKEAPKYLNSKDSKLFNKSAVLYGLDKAWKHIQKAGFVWLTEGNFDVISMHQAGLKNTVATCGTSLSVQHARLLMRYTKKIILLRDGDKAGRNAAMRDIQNLLQLGCQVEFCELPDGEDPDSIARKFTQSKNQPETAEV